MYIRRTQKRLGQSQIRLELLHRAAGKTKNDLFALGRPAAALNLLIFVQRVHFKVSPLLQGIHRERSVAQNNGQAVGQHGIPEELDAVHVILGGEANIINRTYIRGHER